MDPLSQKVLHTLASVSYGTKSKWLENSEPSAFNGGLSAEIQTLGTELVSFEPVRLPTLKILKYLVPRRPETSQDQSQAVGFRGLTSRYMRKGRGFPAQFEVVQDDTLESAWGTICEN